MNNKEMTKRRELDFDPIQVAQDHWRQRSWAAAAPSIGVVTSVMRAQQIFVIQADEVLESFGLTFARWEVLVLLSFARKGTLAAGKISERLQVHPASITNSINRLERAGYVRRMSDPSDGRGRLIKITPAGVTLAKAATETLNAQFLEKIELTVNECHQLFRLLRKVRLAAGDFVPHATDRRETMVT